MLEDHSGLRSGQGYRMAPTLIALPSRRRCVSLLAADIWLNMLLTDSINDMHHDYLVRSSPLALTCCGDARGVGGGADRTR